MDLSDCKLTLEWKDPRTGEKFVTTAGLGGSSASDEEIDIFLVHVRAAFKALYRKVLERLGFDTANIMGRLASQMMDFSQSRQKQSIEQHVELFNLIERNQTVK